MNLNFKLIDENKYNTVLSLLKEAATWLKNKNIDFWQDWHDPPEIFTNWVKNGLKNKQFYLVYNSNELIGMFRLQYSDEIFWGKKSDKAGYIHSFTIKRELSGKGIGYKVLKKIENDLRAKGKEFIRLDCANKIEKLCNYYTDFGFKKAGRLKIQGKDLILLEKLL